MEEYKLELKQIVDYPRCRMYRQFIQGLIGNENLRVGGSSGLYCYTVLCCFANFRTSYHKLAKRKSENDIPPEKLGLAFAGCEPMSFSL